MQTRFASTDTVLSDRDILDVLACIGFKPSCVNMGWEWEVQTSDNPIGCLIRCSFQRPDTDTGAIGRGFGRWWFIAQGSTASSVVKTAWLACNQIVEHEMYEAFTYKGKRVFDPHAEVDDLVKVTRRG